jgi:hypothetical protein
LSSNTCKTHVKADALMPGDGLTGEQPGLAVAFHCTSMIAQRFAAGAGIVMLPTFLCARLSARVTGALRYSGSIGGSVQKGGFTVFNNRITIRGV